jgi:hypothetical protein
MRRAIAVVAAVLALTSAQAARSDVQAWESGVGGIGVSDHQAGDVVEPGATAAPAGGGVAPTYYSYWMIGWAGDRFCRVRHVTTDPVLAAAYNFALHRDFAAANAPGGAAECPAGPVQAAPSAPPPDVLARDFWDVRLLPHPTLKIDPDYAVTGKRVYLQIAGERTKHFDVSDPLGPVIGIDATSTYVVDWGDGTSDTTTSSGGPWPDGDVSHVYTTANPSQTITVAQQWSATWQAGGQQGALNGLRTDGSLTFRVVEVQAVRD